MMEGTGGVRTHAGRGQSIYGGQTAIANLTHCRYPVVATDVPRINAFLRSLKTDNGGHRAIDQTIHDVVQSIRLDQPLDADGQRLIRRAIRNHAGGGD